MSQQQHLNIFCPDHRIRLPVVGPGLLSCDNGPHVLAGDFPFDFWKYCCQCDTFSPLKNNEGDPYDRCASCRCELEDHWYLCENCRVFTTRPRADGPRKKFHLPLQGKGPPQPFCPGCMLETDLRVREHVCESLLDMQAEVYIVTPRSACPLCTKKIPLPTPVVADGNALPANLHVTNSANAEEGRAHVAPLTTTFWQRMRKQWYHGPTLVGVVLGVLGVVLAVVGIGYTAFAHAFPALWEDVYSQYRKRLNNARPAMKLAEPIDHKYVILENQDATLRAIAVDPDGDEFEYDWKVVRSNALIEGNGKSEVTLKTKGIHPEMKPVSVLLRVKAVDVYGAESEPLEIDLSITTESISRPNRPPVITGLECMGCPNWEVHAGALVSLSAAASDPDNDALKYHWQPQGLIKGNGPDVLLDTSLISPEERGNVYVCLIVTDERSEQPQKIERQLTVLARQAPGSTPPPAATPEEVLIIDLRAPDEGAWVKVGDAVTLTATVRDGRKDNLTYEWKTSTNRYEKTDKAIYTFKVEEVRDPFVDVTVTVTDGRGKGFASLRLKVRQPPAGTPPQPTPQPQLSPTPAATPGPPAPKADPAGGRAARVSSGLPGRGLPPRSRRVA